MYAFGHCNISTAYIYLWCPVKSDEVSQSVGGSSSKFRGTRSRRGELTRLDHLMIRRRRDRSGAVDAYINYVGIYVRYISPLSPPYTSFVNVVITEERERETERTHKYMY